MHKWISTDNGSECYRCGMILDYGETDEVSGVIVWNDRTRRESDEAHNLAPYCTGPETGRAHHFVLAMHPASDEMYYLDCAYGDCATDEGRQGGPGIYNPECIGA